MMNAQEACQKSHSGYALGNFQFPNKFYQPVRQRVLLGNSKKLSIFMKYVLNSPVLHCCNALLLCNHSYGHTNQPESTH